MTLKDQDNNSNSLLIVFSGNQMGKGGGRAWLPIGPKLYPHLNGKKEASNKNGLLQHRGKTHRQGLRCY